MTLAAAKHRARSSAVLALTLAMAATSVALTGPLSGSAAARQEPVASSRVQVETVPVPTIGGSAGEPARSTSQTAPQPVHRDLAVVGATWEGGKLEEQDAVQIRVRSEGRWGAWEEMERDDDHGPDTVGPGSPESRGARTGTAPYVVDGEQVQVRVLSDAGTAPRVRVSVIDPGTGPGDDSSPAPAAGAARAAATRPTILTRRDWGADESMRTGSPGYGQAHVAFVHHTAGTNSYSSAQVPGIIRGIYDYHVNGQGWSDIGYNFLVDRFGRIWEGRHGGMDKALIGAHTLNHNSWSFGVAAIGDFTTVSPPAVTVDALERVIAWKLALHGMPATGTVGIVGKTYNRISGHRNAFSTTCPGERLYAALPAIRRDVATRIGSQSRSAVRRSLDGGGTPDLLAYGGSLQPPTLTTSPHAVLAASPQPVRSGVTIGTGWNALDDIVLSPDLTGDGLADVLARDPARSDVRVYAGNGSGGFTGMTRRGGGWNVMTRLVASGDRTGDGRADLLAQRSDGTLVLYPGDGRGWVTGGVPIGTGFGAVTSLASAGDLSGDGHPDLLGLRSTDGTLVLYPGAPGGGLQAARVWGSGWGSLAALASGPDLDGDGHTGDVVVRQKDGAMRTYYADSTGRLTRHNFWGAGWNALDHLSSGADWDGDGVADLLARNTGSSSLVLYAGTGRRDFDASPVGAGISVPGADLVRLVGDVTGDGRSDAVARRSSDGALLALRSRPGGGFDTLPTPIGAGWQIFDQVEAAGDMSNDGVPDLMARTSGGELRLYAMTRSLTFGWHIQLGLGWQVMRSVTGAGSVNQDYNADVVALRNSDGAILLYRGSGPGTLNDAVVALTGQNDLRRLLGVGDYNGDRKNDLLAQAVDGQLWLYPGDGARAFSTYRQPLVSTTGAADVLG